VSSYTVDHCGLKMNTQWSTAWSEIVLGTIGTCVIMESKLLLMQNRYTVVYSGEWDTDGDCCDMCMAGNTVVYGRGCDGPGDYFAFCHNVQ